jgi:hypothetical protein
MARPRLRVETVPHVCDKSITLMRYRRANSLVWEAELTLPDGSKKIVSTRETDLSAAQFVAVEVRSNVIGRMEHTGSPALRTPTKPNLPTFADAATMVLADIQSQRSTLADELRSLPPELLAKKLSKFKKHVSGIKRILCPALGSLAYPEVTGDAIEQVVSGYRIKELDTEGNGIEVLARQSTIGNLSHTYAMVMEKLRRISNSSVPYPRMSRAGMPAGEPRETFSDRELSLIIKAMSNEWVNATKRESHRAIRRLLRAYVHIAATTGIRAGLEMERLSFAHLNRHYDRTAKREVDEITIRADAGKSANARIAVPYIADHHADFAYAMDALRQIHGGAPSPGPIVVRDRRTGKPPQSPNGGYHPAQDSRFQQPVSRSADEAQSAVCAGCKRTPNAVFTQALLRKHTDHGGAGHLSTCQTNGYFGQDDRAL